MFFVKTMTDSKYAIPQLLAINIALTVRKRDDNPVVRLLGQRSARLHVHIKIFMVLPTAYPSPSLGSSAVIGFSHHFKTFKPKLVIYKICVDFSVTEFSFLIHSSTVQLN